MGIGGGWSSGWLDGLGNIADAITDGVLVPTWRPSRRVTVPSVVGMTAADAQVAVTKAGLKFTLHQLQDHPPPTMGIVRSQVPAGGDTVKRGSLVQLDLYHPPPG